MASKSEYLKRYMSAENAPDTSKAKKKVKRKKGRGMVIVDEDVQAKSAALDLSDDDIPIVAAKEPSPELQVSKPKQWKTLGRESESARHEQCADGASMMAMQKQNCRRHDNDESPARKRRQQRHDSGSDSDVSPPRKRPLQAHQGNRGNSDESPPGKRRQQQHDFDSDASPPRRQPHQQPSAKRDSDESLPRKRHQRQHDSDSDASPPRKRPPQEHSPNRGSDESPPKRQRQQRHDSDSDASPPRHRPHAGVSAPPKSASSVSVARKPRARHDSDGDDDGGVVGHRAGKRGVDDGPGTTVFRDKATGRKLDVAMEKKKKRAEEDALAEELAKQMAWGKGLVQKQQTVDKVDEMLHEMSKPLARYRDDSDLDKLQRDEDREGDPMLAFMKKKKKKVDPNKPVRPLWQGQFPTNRFNIRPGYRWDGVNRSNGFEKKCFEMQARRKATASEAYQWSVEDM